MITRVPYKLIFTVPTLLIGLLLLFVLKLDEPAAFYGPACILISAIAALTVATVTIKSNRHTFMQTNSLAFQQALQSDEHYKEAIKGVAKAMSNRKEKPLVFYAGINNLSSDKDKESLDNIRYVINVWERAATACVKGIYDEHYLYTTHKSMVIDIGIQFRYFIHEVQESRNNPDFYKYFTQLVVLWSKRRNLFSNSQIEKELTLVYKQLQSIEAGKLPKKRHKLKKFR